MGSAPTARIDREGAGAVMGRRLVLGMSGWLAVLAVGAAALGPAEVRYRGAIDDQYGLKYRKETPARNYLREALDAILANRPVEVPATEVVGCLLDRDEPAPTARVRPAAPEIVAALEARDAAEP